MNTKDTEDTKRNKPKEEIQSITPKEVRTPGGIIY